MNKLRFVLGLFCFSLTIAWLSAQDKPKFSFVLESATEIDSLSSASQLCLRVVIKNKGDFMPYPALRAVLNGVVLYEAQTNSYGVASDGTEEFKLLLPRLKKNEKQYSLIVESYEQTILDKAEFVYKPKPYKVPKVKKTKREKNKPIEVLEEIKSTPPSPPSN